MAMSLSIDVGSDPGLSNGEATPGKMKSPRDLEEMTPNGSRISLNGGSELSDESELEVTPIASRRDSNNADEDSDVEEKTIDSSQYASPQRGTFTSAAAAEVTNLPILEKFQVEAFLRLLQKQGGRRSLFSRKKDPSSNAAFTVEDMLSFSKDPIPTSLTRMSSDLASRAVKMFLIILKYIGQGGADLTEAERTQLVLKLYKHTLRRLELRDELFAQLTKQLRNNPHRLSSLRAWELLNLIGAAMPPGKELAGYISEFVHEHAHDQNLDPEIRTAALATWQTLKRSVKAGPRKVVPTAEEVDALKERKHLTTIAFFLDDTFEELTYDMTTTVAEAVEELAGIIRLKQFHTFSLFESRRVISAGKAAEPSQDEHICLDENKYVGDLVAEFRAAKEKSKGGEMIQCKLVFKKRLFRETDEAITDSVFVQLSFVQAQHDYLLGNYPVGREDAAQLSALQILAEMGPHPNPESSWDWGLMVDRCLPRQVLLTRPKKEWETDVLTRFKGMIHLGKDDARQQFLRILRALPYGNSVFFNVKRIEDPIGLLPGKLILGINKRGVHFFRPVPKEYLHSAELRDIMQFGSSSTAVFFKMRVAGILHIFQFETKQGEDICVALQTHINDVMLRRYARTRAAQAGGPPAPDAMESAAAARAGGAKVADEGAPVTATPRANEMYEKQIQEMMDHVVAKDAKICSLETERGTLEAQLRRVTEQWEDLRDQLSAEESTHAELEKERDSLRKAIEEKDNQIQAANAAALAAEAKVAAALASAPPSGVSTELITEADSVVPREPTAATPESTPEKAKKGAAADRLMRASIKRDSPAGADYVAKVRALETQMKDLKTDIRKKDEEIRTMDAANKKTSQAKQLAEQKLARLEKSKVEGSKALETKYLAERDELRERLAVAERKLAEQAQAVAALETQLAGRMAEIDAMANDIKELDELREMKEDVDRKNEQTAMLLKGQAERLTQLEGLYRDEQVLRKKYFNQIEDMKGKIRVFCRFRPLSGKESAEDQKMVVTAPDEFTVEHPWKDDKPKQHQFDHVFTDAATQDAVFEDTKYLIQSAVDGYNVCIFAYGQTGSGKTFTIYGTPENPGLTPRAMRELFEIMQRDGNKYSFALKVYMLELYQDNLQDLLLPKKAPKEPKKLEIKKDAKGMVVVEGATLVSVASIEELEATVKRGQEKRHIAGTQMNTESSRSHLVLSIIIESTNLQTQALVKGKLSFVDLAGSERVKKSGSTGEQLKEAQSINKSLSALGDVISALATEEAHIPYRNHKLTMLMSDSLGGNAKTLMFVNASPADTNVDETHNSLIYATRVRSIINTATKNIESKEILRLKKQIAHWKEQAGKKPEEEDLDEIEDKKSTASVGPE
ncbi:Myosin-related protein [Klebsormidium nitens]|uniref:Myosin-related protein n=1 Tax=Klebsormidium nitens TaxID=105231 RepID=A0A1Y1IEL7_KLENI|nr:Myosin-related protein [Klebsormidium nitens]|eukprot:GAQ87147.1 Myosin-related protein [Klebsormidium nitens]